MVESVAPFVLSDHPGPSTNCKKQNDLSYRKLFTGRPKRLVGRAIPCDIVDDHAQCCVVSLDRGMF